MSGVPKKVRARVFQGRWSRRITAIGALTVLVGGLSLFAAPVGAQEGTQPATEPACLARSNLATAVQDEDHQATVAAADALAVDAPAEIAEPASKLSDLVTKRGHQAMTGKKGRKALRAVDAYIAANCGFPVLAVTGRDYLYEGISSSLAAGTYVVQFTNEAPAEHHEFVLSQADAGVIQSVKQFLTSANGSASRLSVVGAAFAKPGNSDTLVVVLEPGRYVYACFIDVETTTGDADEHGEHGAAEHAGAANPHWSEGMRGQFEVVGGI